MVKCSTHKMPAFSIEDGIGHQFLKWISTLFGGGKCNTKNGTNWTMGEQQAESASEGYADCCLGSPSVIMNFFKVVTNEWEMSSSGALNYMKAIGELMDFRKSSGVSDEVIPYHTSI